MPPDSFDPEWLSIQQIVQLSGYSYTKVIRAIWSHELDASQQKANGPWRVRVACYKAWMEGRRVKPVSRVEQSA
jgi:hypothetical protein